MESLDIFNEYFFSEGASRGHPDRSHRPLMGVFFLSCAAVDDRGYFGPRLYRRRCLGFLINVYPVAVGLVFALLASFGIERLRKAYKTYAELSIAILMSGGIAFATLLFYIGQRL